MEDENKIISSTEKNKRKFRFGDIKIRNKIIFGFFVVSVISGLANYYSNLFITNEFRSINSTMNNFHEMFAVQKKIEMAIENFISTDDLEYVHSQELGQLHRKIENNYLEFAQTGGSYIDEDILDKYLKRSEEFFNKELNLTATHKRKIVSKNAILDLQKEEKDKRYVIREIISNSTIKDVQYDFLYVEYYSKEALYQYRDNEHMQKWIKSLDDAIESVSQYDIDIAGLAEYRNVVESLSDAILEYTEIEKEETEKIKEFRFAIENINEIQDEVSKSISDSGIRNVNFTVLIGVFVFTFILMIFTIVFGFIISTFISRPIKHLAEFARIVGNGNFKKRIKIDSQDEIGQTARAFNVMLDKIEESTQVLEIKVNARTKRLEEFSRNLENQIENKTKELNEKIKELERFNDLAVGRELRMVELKREVDFLKRGGVASKEKKNKQNGHSGSEPMNCWDFWKCKKEVRENCPAFLSNMGRECWVLSAGKCPRSKIRGITDCRDCAWYKKINNIPNINQ